jgi:hypothetical protein
MKPDDCFDRFQFKSQPVINHKVDVASVVTLFCSRLFVFLVFLRGFAASRET